MTRTATVATLTGVVDLINPDPATITPEAIAHHLGQQNRYAGALELPLSVAQHAILQTEIFRRLYPSMPAIYALLDDAHEFVWGDMLSPVQEAYAQHFTGFRRVRQNLHNRMDQAIRARFNLPAPGIEICAALKDSDEIAFATEWRSLMPKAAGPCPINVAPMRTIMIKPLPWTAAADLFRETLTRELALFEMDGLVTAAGC